MIDHLRRLHRWWLKKTMTPTGWAIHLWNVAYDSQRCADWLAAGQAFYEADSPELARSCTKNADRCKY